MKISRQTTTAVAALLLGASTTALGAALPLLQPRQDDDGGNNNTNNATLPSLDKLIKAKGKLYFGTATEKAKLVDGEDAIMKANFGQVTPEYSMKWDQTEPTRGQFSWDAADALVDFAQQNGDVVRGHALVWYNALPDWVAQITDKDDLTKVMKNHITTVMKRYAGKVRSWDVVNEPFNTDGTFRSNVFYDVLGEDYVRIAFEAARAADPKAKLYINDYNLDDPSWAELKVGMVPSVTKWVAAGVPIDGIGSQSHLAEGKSGGVEAALRALAGTGVEEVAITELDIPGAPSEDFVAAVEACVAVEKCVGVTVWGISDADSATGDQKPTLFDADRKPKQAYTDIAAALQK